MASTKLILKLNKKNLQNEVPIYIRIIKDRKAQFFSTGIYIKLEQWDEKDKKVRKSHKNSNYINKYLADKIADAERVALEMETSSAIYSSKKAKRIILGKSNESFIQYAEAYKANLEKNGKLGTHDKANAVISKLKAYVGPQGLTFDSIDVAFLKKYEDYLRSTLKNATNTVHSNLKVIRRILNEAINEDIFPAEKNPFLKYKLRWENVAKTFLTEDELKLVEEYPIVSGTKKFHHRNMYIFAAYAGGLRISDVLQLKWENFDGERVLVKTQKTSSVVSIKLPQKALGIINSYKTEESKPSDFIFPFFKNDRDYSDPKLLFDTISSMTAYTNKDLYDIAKKLELNKPMNFHTSRHTWATRALKKGMRIEYVSKLMGHSSIKTTQVYAKIVNADLDKAMEVFDDVPPSKKEEVPESKEKKQKVSKKV